MQWAPKDQPLRKNSIVSSTLDVVSERGVARTTHRVIAERAGVPLGSMSYYFRSMGDLLGDAFDLFHTFLIEEQANIVRRQSCREGVIHSVVELTCGDGRFDKKTMQLIVEMYAYAKFNKRVERACQEVSQSIQNEFKRFLSAESSFTISALIDGWRLKSFILGEIIDEEYVRSVLRDLVDHKDR